MAVFKCKMCGGTLEIGEDQTIATCEYCATKQTLPRLNDEHKINLYDRANHFRRSNEFDKAVSIYEQILSEDNTDAESYWSLVLCRYGIEYVEDPVSHKRVPTVNRAQYTSIYTDENYLSAIRYADPYQKEIYESEAKTIDDIQKGILEISSKEEPFDVFICYKESDERGNRTQDSVHAQEIYYQLTEKGYKVFFSRITLESKIGRQYEPYIFAALNSAKVMVIVGTKPEYFNAVWVKNEWSRFLKIAQQEKDRLIIPVYRDMDPYDLPEALSYYQAQDMSRIGFIQDLIRGIDKVLSMKKEEEKVSPSGAPVKVGANNDSLLKRGYMALEDREWDMAFKYFDQILNNDAECSEAYLGQAFAEERVSGEEEYISKRLKQTEECQKKRHNLLMEEDRKQELLQILFNAGFGEKDAVFFGDKADYYTSFDERKKQYEEEINRTETNKSLKRAIRFAKDGRLPLQDKLEEVFQKRVRDTEEEDKRAREEVVQRFRDAVQNAATERQYKYENAVKLYESGNYVKWNSFSEKKDRLGPVTQAELKATFLRLGSFRDAAAYYARISAEMEAEDARIKALQDRKSEIINSFRYAGRLQYMKLEKELKMINAELERIQNF